MPIKMTSLDAALADGTSEEFHDRKRYIPDRRWNRQPLEKRLADGAQPSSKLENQERDEQIELALRKLSSQDRGLIWLRFGIGSAEHSLYRLATQHGMSTEGMRKKLKSILQRMLYIGQI